MLPWVLIGIIVVLIILGFVAWAMKGKQETDYYTFFVIGVVWTFIGIPQMIWDDFSTFFILGLVFMGVGLAHKDKWKKNYQKPTLAKKRATWIAIGIGLFILLLITFFYWV